MISTKVGRRLVPTGPQDASVGREGYFSPRPFAPVFDYGYDSVMRSHAESLERLGVSRVDILLCHDIGRLTHGETHAARVREFLDGGYRAMRELRDAGAVRAIGLGVNEWEVCVELLRALRARLHPARRPLHAARAARAGNAAAAVRAARACPSSAAARSIREFSRPARAPARRLTTTTRRRRPTVLERVRQLEALCAEFAVPLQAAALQFPLGASRRRERRGRLRQWRRSAQLRRDVLASDSRRVLARAARARAGRRARTAARVTVR